MTRAVGYLGRVVAALAVGALAVTAARAADAPSLTVFAAADLAFALRDLATRFDQAMGTKTTLVFGSTGQLAKQVEHGAPADLFFAADRAFIDDLAAKGAVLPETVTLYAQGRLALVAPRATTPRVDDLRRLRDARIRRIAIANPQHAPYGRAAEQALRAVGVWEAVRPKLVYGENVRQTLQYVETGAADAGIVALSIADVPSVEFVAIDPALHEPIDQAMAVVRRSARADVARAFARFVNGPEGRAVMKRYRFLLPGEF